jgi:thiosulfate/3-mercaptopyruvate sulfurtransferase
MRSRTMVLTLTLAVTVGTTVPAASPRESLLVSTAWLAEHLQDPDLVLLQVSSEADYKTSHIRGARYVPNNTLSTQRDGLSLEMLPPDVLRDRLASLGISDNSRVVAYFGPVPSWDKDYLSPVTRIVFTLDYAGLGKRVSVLDGGLPAWVRENRPVTDDIPAPTTGILSPLKMRDTVVDADYVLKSLKAPGVAVIDGRSGGFYDGVLTGGRKDSPHRAGHIAGALTVPFSAVTDDQFMLRSQQELEAIFAKAGVKPGDTIIGYCHIGQQATAMLFAAQTLGHPGLLYDGSFEDWSRRPNYPVDNPAAKGRGEPRRFGFREPSAPQTRAHTTGGSVAR